MASLKRGLTANLFGEMINMKTVLIGSAPSLDALIKLVVKKWYWSSVEFKEDGSILNSKGQVVKELRWIKKGNRFRLEWVYEN